MYLDICTILRTCSILRRPPINLMAKCRVAPKLRYYMKANNN